MRTILTLLCFSLNVFAADDLPKWVISPPKHTSDERFYVGSAANLPSHGEAIQQASKMAIEQALRENFGTEARLSSESYESNTASTVVTRMTENSRSIRLQGFETKDTAIRQNKKGFSAYILFSYKLSEIEAEQRRLKNLASGKQEPIFSEIGNTSSLAKGRLEIITSPEGAGVVIDGKDSITKTPIRLSGVLDAGEHSLVLDHPDYEEIQESFVVVPGKTTRIEKTLIPATGTLSVQTNPTNATVILNGSPIGSTPISALTVPANRKIRLEFIHPDSQVSSFELTVARNENRKIEETLRLKDAKLLISCKPSTAKIVVDGEEKNKGWVTTKPGSHAVVVSAENYQTKRLEVVLRGGEQRIENVNLTPLSEIARRKQNYPWIVGAGIGFYGATSEASTDLSSVGIDLNFEKRVGFLGIRISGSFIGAEDTKSDGSARKMSGNVMQVSLPLYIGDLYLAPTYGIVKQDFTCKAKTPSCSDLKLNQSLFGGTLGYQHYWGDLGIDANYSLGKYSNDGDVEGRSAGIVQLLMIYKF